MVGLSDIAVALARIAAAAVAGSLVRPRASVFDPGAIGAPRRDRLRGIVALALAVLAVTASAGLALRSRQASAQWFSPAASIDASPAEPDASPRSSAPSSRDMLGWLRAHATSVGLKLGPLLLILLALRIAPRALGLTARGAIDASLAGVLAAAIAIAADFGVRDRGIPEPCGALFIFASGMLLTALSEELFFRGFVQNRLQQWLGPACALAIASLLFGLMHAAPGIARGETLATVGARVFFTSCSGCAFGVLLLRTGHLAAPVFMHALLNAARPPW